ncbi:MAG TPA: DUF2752 domain-containing protein [Bacteroidales bacterium]|nr:DUF2752 domain-containing protein [Bacteroidales bacterium]
MTRQRSANKIRIAGFEFESYILLNIILAGVIVMIMLYSGIFSPVRNNYPVVCMHEKITGVPCASCGLSHSFSLILRGRFSEARIWNVYGIRVFLFFALQLLMRAGFSVLYNRYTSRGKHLIISDSVISAIMFVYAFGPYMKWIFMQLIS